MRILQSPRQEGHDQLPLVRQVAAMAVEGAAFQAALEKYGGATAINLFRGACVVLILDAVEFYSQPYLTGPATGYVILNLLGFPAWLRTQVKGAAKSPLCPSCSQSMHAIAFDCGCGTKTTLR